MVQKSPIDRMPERARSTNGLCPHEDRADDMLARADLPSESWAKCTGPPE